MSIIGDDLLDKEAELPKDMEGEYLEDDDDTDEDLCCCGKCGEEMPIDDLTYFDETYLCPDCLDEYTYVCYDCGSRGWNDDSYIYNDCDICHNCYYNHYSTCNDCGRIIHNDDARYFDSDEYSDDPYCENCYEKQSDLHIKNYNYKPEPIFYGSGLFYGVELEIDKGGENRKNAGILLDIANGSEEHLYCKHDGSLIEGFELVSHPMSLEYHCDCMPWKDLLLRALSLGYKSHDTDTCGLHVHVGRKQLGCDYETTEGVVARILFFIEKHWEPLLKFSRRTEAQISRWAARYGCGDNPKDTLKFAKDKGYTRYVSLNIQNYETIEFRMFRGTLKYATFIATLQLVDEICNAAMSKSDEEFQSMKWVDFVKGIGGDSKKELLDYLKQRQLYNISEGEV